MSKLKEPLLKTTTEISCKHQGEFENMENRRIVGKRKLAVGFAILIAFSSVLISQAAATDDELNLPSSPIRIEVSDGMESYFSTKLSDVPSDYDVTNGTYLGWCIDARTEMPRSPATHAVILYSSNSPPGELAGERWDMVNYILNHKQGTAQDIQQSIWYFIRMDGKYVPTSSQAWNIINETIANGDGFVPESGQIVAVVCFPVVLHPELNSVQISIIEVQIAVIPEFPVFLILPLFVVETLLVVAIYRRKPRGH